MNDPLYQPSDPNQVLAAPATYDILFNHDNAVDEAHGGRPPRRNARRRRILGWVAFALVALLMVLSLLRMVVFADPKLRITLVDAGQYATVVSDVTRDFAYEQRMHARDIQIRTLSSADGDQLRRAWASMRADNVQDVIVAPAATLDRLAEDGYVTPFSSLAELQYAQGSTAMTTDDATTWYDDQYGYPSNTAASQPSAMRGTWYELPIDGAAGQAPGTADGTWDCTRSAASESNVAQVTCRAVDDGTDAGRQLSIRTYEPASIVVVPRSDDHAGDGTADSDSGTDNGSNETDGGTTNGSWTQRGPIMIRQTKVYGLRLDTSARWTAARDHAGAAATNRAAYVLGLAEADPAAPVSYADSDGVLSQTAIDLIAYLRFLEPA
ncbi:hypothetical protein [Bifidobacterium biavatii]|uniref:Uncharacterized protein n=1 Tax=Bifidobacterium biavatii DSM 23969 TaxID=1437608 RepID=A0A086ZXF0_9BIFI|nr:hypothetical protein [Bifidobacterium biavatii]KFI51200.1 hypothetical protein BBIA_0762 [Bifidobacterium biavatii DSM 23969]